MTRRYRSPSTPEGASAVRGAFAQRLAAARVSYGQRTKRLGFTAADMARELGIDEERYRKYERGESEAPYWLLSRIADVLGESIDYLITGARDRPPRDAA